MNAEVQLTARMLRALSFLPWLSAALTIVAAAALLSGSANRVGASLAIALGLVAGVYGFRIALDAWLFEDILEGRLTTAELDSVLGKEDRPWADRCRGARRLMILGAVATALQMILMIASALR
jgi:hypothetical protein